MASKLKEEAARLISEAGISVKADEIQCVTGYWKRLDCYRFEITRRDFIAGCWLSLTQFVRECRQHGGAKLIKDGLHYEIYPDYPQKIT